MKLWYACSAFPFPTQVLGCHGRMLCSAAHLFTSADSETAFNTNAGQIGAGEMDGGARALESG